MRQHQAVSRRKVRGLPASCAGRVPSSSQARNARSSALAVMSGRAWVLDAPQVVQRARGDGQHQVGAGVNDLGRSVPDLQEHTDLFPQTSLFRVEINDPAVDREVQALCNPVFSKALDEPRVCRVKGSDVGDLQHLDFIGPVLGETSHRHKNHDENR